LPSNASQVQNLQQRIENAWDVFQHYEAIDKDSVAVVVGDLEDLLGQITLSIYDICDVLIGLIPGDHFEEMEGIRRAREKAESRRRVSPP
jgi:hypothetical protein